MVERLLWEGLQARCLRLKSPRNSQRRLGQRAIAPIQRLDLRLNSLCNQLARAGLERGDHLAAVVRGAAVWALSRLMAPFGQTLAHGASSH